MRESNQNDRDLINYLDTLGASLKKKEKLLISLIALTKKQEEILKQETFDTEKFDAIIEEKSSFIDEINLLDEGFDSIFSLIKEKIIPQAGAFKEYIIPMQEMIRRLTDKGVELETLERRNQLKLEYAIAKDKTKIKQFNISNGAAARYYSSMMNGPESSNVFVDKKK